MHRLDVGPLVGRHVTLEPLRVAHAADIAEAAATDRTTFGHTWVPDGPDDAMRYVEQLGSDAAAHRAAPFVQRRVDDGALVGCTRFLHPAWPLGRVEPDEVEIGGTWLIPAVQGTAINAEAKLLLLGHAFEVWRVQRVAICTDVRNTRSRRAIERLGARLDGVLPKHRRQQGDARSLTPTLRDTAVYSILDDAWPEVRDRLTARIEA